MMRGKQKGRKKNTYGTVSVKDEGALGVVELLFDGPVREPVARGRVGEAQLGGGKVLQHDVLAIRQQTDSARLAEAVAHKVDKLHIVRVVRAATKDIPLDN